MKFNNKKAYKLSVTFIFMLFLFNGSSIHILILRTQSLKCSLFFFFSRSLDSFEDSHISKRSLNKQEKPLRQKSMKIDAKYTLHITHIVAFHTYLRRSIQTSTYFIIGIIFEECELVWLMAFEFVYK